MLQMAPMVAASAAEAAPPGLLAWSWHLLLICQMRSCCSWSGGLHQQCSSSRSGR
jgi:hypothetical protein